MKDDYMKMGKVLLIIILVVTVVTLVVLYKHDKRKSNGAMENGSSVVRNVVSPRQVVRRAAPVAAQQPTAAQQPQAAVAELLCEDISLLDVSGDCITPLYSDLLDCMVQREDENCVTANDDPVANYYDCADEQYAYCQDLPY